VTINVRIDSNCCEAKPKLKLGLHVSAAILNFGVKKVLVQVSDGIVEKFTPESRWDFFSLDGTEPDIQLWVIYHQMQRRPAYVRKYHSTARVNDSRKPES